MADPLPLDTATLAGLFAGSILYGIFLVLFVGCLHVLLRNRKTQRPNTLLLCVAIVMFVLNTCILALSYSRVQDAFIVYRDAPGGPVGRLMELSQWKEVARTTLCSTYIFVADLTLIYRCWIVWSRRLSVVVVPLIIHVAYTATSVLLNFTLAGVPVGSTIFNPEIQRWITAALVLSLGQNVIVTSLIVLKIWSVNRTASSGSNSMNQVIAMIIESGMIYVITCFVYLVTYFANSNSQYILIDILNPVVGITFSLLVVRVGLRNFTVTSEARTEKSSHTIRSLPTHQIPLQPISISVRRDWHTNYESGSTTNISPTDSPFEKEATRSLSEPVTEELEKAV